MKKLGSAIPVLLMSLLLSCTVQVAAQNRTGKGQEDILFLCSINFDHPWSKRLYESVHDTFSPYGFRVCAEALNIPAITSREEADSLVAELRIKYPSAPRAVVFMGDPGWMVCRELFTTEWKDAPAIITGATDMLPATLDDLLSHKPIGPGNTVSAGVWREGYNVVAMEEAFHVRETIELMRSLLPDMKRVLLVSDDRFISSRVRKEVESTVTDFFPELDLEQFTPMRFSTDQLLDTLRKNNPRTGIIFYSWFRLSRKDNHPPYLMEHIREIIKGSVQAPVFALAPESMTDNMFVGGCYNRPEEYMETLVSLLRQVTLEDKPLDTGAAVISRPPATYLYYPLLRTFHIPVSRCPRDAVFIDAPQSFWLFYREHLLWGTGIALVVIVMLVVHSRNLRKSRTLALAAENKAREALQTAELERTKAEMARKAAEEADRLKSAFIANISHEIRTPLNAIVGFSSLLDGTTDDKEQQEQFVSIIRSNSEQLLQLIGDILEVSKIESGVYKFKSEPVDVNRLLEEVRMNVNFRLDESRVRFMLSPVAADTIFHTDRRRLEQVLQNLTVNAIKFTAEGYIELGCSFPTSDSIRFYVTDTGCGMTAEQCGRVFDRFVKFNAFTQGTGLGLSICKSIVEAMGGTISVESEPDKGSTFSVTLPYQPHNRITGDAGEMPS